MIQMGFLYLGTKYQKDSGPVHLLLQADQVDVGVLVCEAIVGRGVFKKISPVTHVPNIQERSGVCVFLPS